MLAVTTRSPPHSLKKYFLKNQTALKLNYIMEGALAEAGDLPLFSKQNGRMFAGLLPS